MCTVTFVPGKRGYLLGMNRDEQRTRPRALAPRIHNLGTVSALFPYERSGGTWIGVNDRGVTLALINWYSIEKRVKPVPVSRGTVIPGLLECTTSRQLEQTLSVQPLDSVYPFRLVAVFPSERRLVEWRWNQLELDQLRHEWLLTGWFSSGFDEPGAQVHRAECLHGAAEQITELNPADWLRRFHSSHSPQAGPYSVCMHRDDAATVSYTELSVDGDSVRMSYTVGAPCNPSAAPVTEEMKISQGTNHPEYPER